MNRLLKQFMALAMAPFALRSLGRASHWKSAGMVTATVLPFARLMCVQSHAVKRSSYGTR